MTYLLHPVRTLPYALCDYLLTGLGDPPDAIQVAGGGMPSDTLLIEARSVIVSLTCVSPPMFRTKMERLARDQAIDVLLVRCCQTILDVLPASVDVVLAGGGLSPTTFINLAIYRHDDGALWLVPLNFGGAVRLECDGLDLHLVPPYKTLVQRAVGIYRATAELSALLYPQAVRS